jgi:hypothetical protein
MLTLDQSILSVARSPGTTLLQSFESHGQRFRIKPDERRMIINVTFGDRAETVYNSSNGCIEYELSSSDLVESSPFLNGDDRLIVDKNYYGMSQLFVTSGVNGREIYLGYRPIVTSYIETDLNQTSILRIYLVNMNSSQSLELQDNFRVKISSTDTICQIRSIVSSSPITDVSVIATIGEVSEEVNLPSSTVLDSTIIRIETVIFNVMLVEVDD